MSQAKPISSIISPAVGVLVVLSMAALGAPSARAQEDVTGPPPALQWPTSVSAHAGGALPFQVNAAGTMGLRHSIEDAADLELCKMLMKDASMPVPTDPKFAYADCPASIKAKIDSGDESGGFGLPNIITVPAGQTLVIETVSLQLDVTPAGSQLEAFVNYTSGGKSVTVFVPLTFAYTQTSNGFDTYTATQAVRLYADPGTTVSLTAFSPTGSTGTLFLTVSGYLI